MNRFWPGVSPSVRRSEEALKSAIRGAQRGVVAYPEFKRLSRQAGCVGYVAWLAGRKVTYFGRRGKRTWSMSRHRDPGHFREGIRQGIK